jgi:hypothetical protein
MVSNKINNKKNKSARLYKDPETYFSKAKTSNKFNTIDNLDESTDRLPKNQKWIITSYVESDPGLQELWESFAFGEFLKKGGDTVVKTASEKKDGNFLLKSYKSYKQINHEYINREFEKKYGSDYDKRRILKHWLVCGDLKTAKKIQDEIAQECKDMGIGIHMQVMGYWIPFNPSREECDSFKSTNKKMNEIMGGQLMHKKAMKSQYNERRNVLKQKFINDLEEEGGGARLDKTENSDGKTVIADEKLDKKYNKQYTKEELKKEFDLMTPKHLIDMKHKAESTKHEKMLKDLITTEIEINGGETLNPDIINVLSDKDIYKKNTKNKIIESRKKMKDRVKKIKSDNKKALNIKK